MLKNKVNCLVAKAEVVKLKVESVLEKVNNFIDSSEYGNKLKNNIKRIVKGIGTVIIAVGGMLPIQAYAESTDNIANVGVRIREVFNPIVEMLASLGYPTAYAMLIVGGLMVITGRKAKGLEIIKWASVGYIALQIVPFLLNVLEMIGSALRGSVL